MLSGRIQIAEAFLQNILFINSAPSRISKHLRHDVEGDLRTVGGRRAYLALLTKCWGLASLRCLPQFRIHIERHISCRPKLDLTCAECALDRLARRHARCARSVATCPGNFLLEKCVKRTPRQAQGKAGMLIGDKARIAYSIKWPASFRLIGQQGPSECRRHE